VKNAEARVNELRRLIDIELERIRASSSKDFEQARNVEERLRGDVEQLRQRALVAAQASVKLRDLEREVDVNRGLYQSFFARSRQTEEAQPSNLMSTHIVTTATPPAARSFPPGAGLMMAAGFVLGGLLGGALSVFLEMRNGTGRTTLTSAPSDEAAREPDAVYDHGRDAIHHSSHLGRDHELNWLAWGYRWRAVQRMEANSTPSPLISSR